MVVIIIPVVCITWTDWAACSSQKLRKCLWCSQLVFCELNWLRSVPQGSKTDSSRLGKLTLPRSDDVFRAEEETSRKSGMNIQENIKKTLTPACGSKQRVLQEKGFCAAGGFPAPGPGLDLAGKLLALKKWLSSLQAKVGDTKAMRHRRSLEEAFTDNLESCYSIGEPWPAAAF